MTGVFCLLLHVGHTLAQPHATCRSVNCGVPIDTEATRCEKAAHLCHLSRREMEPATFGFPGQISKHYRGSGVLTQVVVVNLYLTRRC